MKVVLEKKAAKYLEGLDVVLKRRITEALKDLAAEPPSGDMEILAIREKLHTFIDEMPDRCILSVEPLLSYLASERSLETDLTNEEKTWVLEGRKLYKEHPEDFVLIDSVK